MEAWASLAPQIIVALVIVSCAAWLARETRRRSGPSGCVASKDDVSRLEGRVNQLADDHHKMRTIVQGHGGKLDAILTILRGR